MFILAEEWRWVDAVTLGIIAAAVCFVLWVFKDHF